MGGVVQGIVTPLHLGIQCMYIANTVSTPDPKGIRRNGKSKEMLSTYGRPKMSGSLMKKMPIGREILPNCFNFSLFAKKHIRKASGKVDPTPPKVYII